MSKVQVDNIVNKEDNGPPTLSRGVNVVGVVSATGATLSGVTTTTNLVATNTIYTGITTTAINKTLVNRELCTVVAAGVTVTLPASPSAGWEVGVTNGNFTNTVVARNGSNIMGLAENITLDIPYLSFNFIYIDTAQGWRVF